MAPVSFVAQNENVSSTPTEKSVARAGVRGRRQRDTNRAAQHKWSKHHGEAKQFPRLLGHSEQFHGAPLKSQPFSSLVQPPPGLELEADAETASTATGSSERDLTDSTMQTPAGDCADNSMMQNQNQTPDKQRTMPAWLLPKTSVSNVPSSSLSALRAQGSAAFGKLGVAETGNGSGETHLDRLRACGAQVLAGIPKRSDCLQAFQSAPAETSPPPPCMLQQKLQFQSCLLGTVPTIEATCDIQSPFLAGQSEERVGSYSCAPLPVFLKSDHFVDNGPKESLTSDYAFALDMPMKIDVASLTCSLMKSVDLGCRAL